MKISPGSALYLLSSYQIYHSFHDEVDVYRQHWWRCNGPCQTRKPYFGFVKRAMNRAPSSLDPWWEDHQRTCGGTYTKVKEPEGYGQKKKKDGKQNGKSSEKKASGNEKLSSTTTGDELVYLLCFSCVNIFLITFSHLNYLARCHFNLYFFTPQGLDHRI